MLIVAAALEAVDLTILRGLAFLAMLYHSITFGGSIT